MVRKSDKFKQGKWIVEAGNEIGKTQKELAGLRDYIRLRGEDMLYCRTQTVAFFS